jgi:hypothetical protein
VKHASEAPRVLLSTRSLSGVSLATRDRVLEASNRYREPESLAVTFSKALDAGADGVLACPTPALERAIKKLRRDVPVYAVVPVLTEQERVELEPTIELLLERSIARHGLRARIQVGMARAVRPAAWIGTDWAGWLPLVFESDLSGFSKRYLRGVVLDAWLTDLALAAGHRRLFESYVRFIRSRFRVGAGFETHNLGLLLGRLEEWGLKPDLVIGPVNPGGVMMKPSASDVLERIAATEAIVVAKDLCPGGTHSLEDGVRYARANKVRGIAPDLCDLTDAGAELRALRA